MPAWRQHYDKLLLVLAVAALGLGWAWGARQSAMASPAHPGMLDQPRRAETFSPDRPRADGTAPAPWKEPANQRRGEGWRYEVFAPPRLHYDHAAGTFTVLRAEAPVELPGEIQSGWKLIAVKRAPYRLQYAGYFGSPADPRVTFTSPLVPAPVIARPGERLPDLAVTLLRFEIGKRPVSANEAGSIEDVVVRAVLYDEKLDQEVELDSRSTRYTATPQAILAGAANGHVRREVVVGDTLHTAEAVYRVQNIRLDPAEVVLSPLTPGRVVPGVVVLRLDPPDAPSRNAPREAPPPVPDRVAINEP